MAWSTFTLLCNHRHQAPPGNLLLTNSVTCTCHPTLHLSHPRRKDTSPPSFLPLSPLVRAGDTRAARRKKKAAMSHNNSQMWKSATGKKSNLIWQQTRRKNVKNFTLQRRPNDSTKIMHLNPKQHKMEKKKGISPKVWCPNGISALQFGIYTGHKRILLLLFILSHYHKGLHSITEFYIGMSIKSLLKRVFFISEYNTIK